VATPRCATCPAQRAFRFPVSGSYEFSPGVGICTLRRGEGGCLLCLIQSNL
jgi:hypothetical protein